MERIILPLAPIQKIMLGDSLAEPEAAHHVEYLEITFARDIDADRLAAAWRQTVKSCEILRTGFSIFHGVADGMHPVDAIPEMETGSISPTKLGSLLDSGQVPWRTTFNPDARKWQWTFHHALLDGRSITRILHVFIANLSGAPSATLSRSVWQPPSKESVRIAAESFRRINRECPPADWPPDLTSKDDTAVRSLGRDFASALESRATTLKVTAATIVIWSWGQALAHHLGIDTVLVEQIRAGAPQPGTAGFTMNLLPLRIPRTPVTGLPAFRAELLAMRQFETVSPEDFSAGIYPNTAHAPVIMVERSTLRHALGHPELIESVALRENPADVPSATAFLQPDLQLEMEGPHRHALLDRWCAVLESTVLGFGDF